MRCLSDWRVSILAKAITTDETKIAPKRDGMISQEFNEKCMIVYFIRVESN